MQIFNCTNYTSTTEPWRNH